MSQRIFLSRQNVQPFGVFSLLQRIRFSENANCAFARRIRFLCKQGCTLILNVILIYVDISLY